MFLIYLWFLFLFVNCVSFLHQRSTKPLHQHQTLHQQPAPATSPPHPRAWSLPPRRPKATPPCPPPQLCTTPPATVAYLPISVNGMCRTELNEATHTHFTALDRPAGDVSLGGGDRRHKHFLFLFLAHRGRRRYHQRRVCKIERSVSYCK